MSQRFVMILGGTRSGKSRHGAERAAALAGDRPVVFVATAWPMIDPELDRRIADHVRARPRSWPTIEAGDDLDRTLRAIDPRATVLVDGFTLWVSGLQARAALDPSTFLEGPVAALLEAIAIRTGPVVVVSDEIGLGLVPMDAEARAFRDLLGVVHQRLAAAADEVILMVAGLPLTLKQ